MKRAIRRWEFWVAIIALSVSLGLWAFTIYHSATVGRKLSSYTEIDATIVEYTLETHGTIKNRKSHYYAIVEYKVDGKTYRAKDKRSTNVIGKEGSPLKIAYNPDDPAECIFVRSEKSLMTFLYVFTAGITAVGIAVTVFIVTDLKRIKLMNTYANAKFITSAASKTQFLTFDKPVIAVCGKSNVGKSSFINMLANQKHLAKVSGEPGRTRLINYFDFGSFILADLPGYGYAKVSKAEKAKWGQLLDDFFKSGQSVTHVFALCDIRHEPTADDKTMLNFLYASLIPFTVIATKADKLSKAQLAKAIATVSASYAIGKDAVIPTSAKTRFGLEKVIEEINKVVEVHAEKLGDHDEKTDNIEE